MGETTLVTGATGFLGGALVRCLQAMGLPVIAQGRDPARLAALRLTGAGIADAALIDTLLARLSPAAEAAPVTDQVILLFRLAARIADNRTVAGVHYPVDSAHGALLGFGTTLAFIGHCLGGGADHPVPEWMADGNDWSGDFTLRKWCAALGLSLIHISEPTRPY